jgi:hypothetical protein
MPPEGEAAGQESNGEENEETVEETTETETETETEEFDEERAKAKIAKANREAANLRKRLKEAEPLAKKAKELEEASKSAEEKLEERATGAEGRASKAEQEVARLRIALRKGLTETQAKRLIGENEEELEKDADELLESFRSDGDEGPEPRRRPQERLRPGAAPSADAEPSDPKKLAEQVSRGW